MYKNRRKKQKTTTDQKKVQVRKGNGNIQMIKHTTRRHAELSVHKSTSDKSHVRKKGRHLQKCRNTGGETPHNTKSVIIKVTQELTIAMTQGCNINKNSTKEEATLTHADDRSY